MKLDSGDAFERKHAEWIRRELPFYEEVWSAFIGHDGIGRPCVIQGLDEETEKERKQFYQAHYSFARSMRKMDTIAAELNQTLGSTTSYDEFEDQMDLLTELFLWIGHVRDMFKLISESLKSKDDLHAPLQDFYAKRSHIIHAPSLPAKLDGDLLKVPKTGGSNLQIGEWDNHSTWDSIPDENYVFLRDFACDSTSAFKSLVNDTHGKVFNAADRRFAGKRISPPPPPAKDHTIRSGDLFFPAISAFGFASDSTPISGFHPSAKTYRT